MLGIMFHVDFKAVHKQNPGLYNI